MNLYTHLFHIVLSFLNEKRKRNLQLCDFLKILILEMCANVCDIDKSKCIYPNLYLKSRAE